jgi:hypothetical protein
VLLSIVREAFCVASEAYAPALVSPLQSAANLLEFAKVRNSQFVALVICPFGLVSESVPHSPVVNGAV